MKESGQSGQWHRAGAVGRGYKWSWCSGRRSAWESAAEGVGQKGVVHTPVDHRVGVQPKPSRTTVTARPGRRADAWATTQVPGTGMLTSTSLELIDL